MVKYSREILYHGGRLDSDQVIKVYKENEVIFREGEQGGDLYFIQEGLVQVFIERDGRETTLLEMGPGEVLGVMTCLTRLQRMASARAIDETKVKFVEHQSIAKAMGKMPQWLGFVLKDYHSRVMQIDNEYNRSVHQVEALKRKAITESYGACQLINGLIEFGKFFISGGSGSNETQLDPLLSSLAITLGRDKTSLQDALLILLNAGIIKGQTQSAKLPQTLPIQVIQGIKSFCDFVEKTKEGLERRLIEARLTKSCEQQVRAVIEYGQKNVEKSEEKFRVKVAELEEKLKEATGKEFDLESLAEALNIKLFEYEKEPDEVLIFDPGLLSGLMAHVEAYHLLEKTEEVEKVDEVA